MSDLTKLHKWFTDYLIPAGKPTSVGGYVEDVTWEDHRDEDRPKGGFHAAHTDDCVAELLCSLLGVTQVQLNSWQRSFDWLAAESYSRRFCNQLSFRRSKPFQRHIHNLLELESHAIAVYKYDLDFGHTVPGTNLSDYLV